MKYLFILSLLIPTFVYCATIKATGYVRVEIIAPDHLDDLMVSATNLIIQNNSTNNLSIDLGYDNQSVTIQYSEASIEFIF